MQRNQHGRFTHDPISRIGRTELQRKIAERRREVMRRVGEQSSRLPRPPAQCVLAWPEPKRGALVMPVEGLGDEWLVNGDTATLVFEDGRSFEIWFGQRIIELSCHDTDGVVFALPVQVGALVGQSPADMAGSAVALVGDVLDAADRRCVVGGVQVRHVALAARIIAVAEAATPRTPSARDVLRRLVMLAREVVKAGAAPITDQAQRSLSVMQLRLYDLSATDLSVNISTTLGNMLSALISGESGPQRQALGWA
jgi:hypothetical protein